MIIQGRPYEIAEKYNLRFSYRHHNGNVNGAVTFWRNGGDEAAFAIISENGEGETWEQILELI